MSIELKGASFAYPGGFMANKNLNLTILAGERLAIVGQNGAGKTTAVKLMNGLHKPVEGDVLVDGQNTKEHTTAQIARTVGYVFQNPDDQIFNQSVRAEIEYMPRYFKLPQAEIDRRVERAVGLTGLEGYLKKNPFDIPYPIRKFVSIAAVLATEPKYVIFDEPTAGQDRRGTLLLESMMEQLQSEGITVITITHDMEFVARNFNRVVAMAHGNILADGTARSIFGDAAVVAEARLRKPQLGELAGRLGLGEDILFCNELVAALD